MLVQQTGAVVTGIRFNEAVTGVVTVTSVNGGLPISPGDNSIDIVGTLFEATQGAGVVTVSPSDDITDTEAVTLSTVGSWSDTLIEVDIPSDISLLYQNVFVFVTNDTGDSNSNGALIDLEPSSGRQFVVIEAQHPEGVIQGVTGIEFGLDQIDYQVLSDEGGTVRISESGYFEVEYASAPPTTDIIFLRLGDASDQTWSSGSLQSFNINNAALVAEPGAYLSIGTDVDLRADYSLIAEPGLYLPVGTDVNLTADFSILAEAGSYLLTGTDINFPINENLVAESGSYATFGNDVELVGSYRLVAESGNYLLAGTDINFPVGQFLTAESGAYLTAGTDVELTGIYSLIVESGAYELTGTDIIFPTEFQLSFSVQGEIDPNGQAIRVIIEVNGQTVKSN